MARELVASDDFNRANENLGSPNWTQINTNWGNVNIVSNEIAKVVNNNGNEAKARWTGSGTWTADQYAKMSVGTLNQGGGMCGVVLVRASADTDSNRDYYEAFILDNAAGSPASRTTKIRKCVNGATTELHSDNYSWASNDTCEIEAEGSTIRVLRNGSVLAEVTDTEIAGSSAHRAGVGKGGDNWEGGNITAGGGGLPASAESAYIPGGMQPQTSPLTISKW